MSVKEIVAFNELIIQSIDAIKGKGYIIIYSEFFY